MFTRRRITVASGVALSVGILALSHWFAYSQGVATQAALAARFADEAAATHALDNATALEGGVHVFRRAVKHPEAFPPEELRDWKEKLARWRLTVKQIAIPYLRVKGRDDLANRYEQLVQEALALEDQLRV